jgi:formyltetrahydrofolate deformylase
MYMGCEENGEKVVRMKKIKNHRAILLITCPDQPGIVTTVSNFIFQQGGNIVDSDQHTDLETGVFFMRLEWDLADFRLSKIGLLKKIRQLSQKYNMQTEFYESNKKSRMAIMVSKYEHCLYDLLVRRELGELEVAIPLILSNHPDLKSVAQHFKVPFYCLPVRANQKEKDEAKQLALLKSKKIDFVVLARYMQILGPKFVQAYPHRIINIHHSFLPAFVGGKPYHQAYARGVKVIGATAHYVTETLDEGPIIEQSVVRVSHRDRVEDLVRLGRDQEKVALAHAVRMHLEHRILTYNNKTVVFE